MRAIIIDTETTGLVPRGTKNVTMANLDSFPYIVQISYLVCNDNDIEKTVNYVIRLPSHVVMDNDTISIHKITNEESQQNGVDLKQVLLQLAEDLKGINYVVGHNIDFDWTVIKAEMHRLTRENLNTEDHLKYWGYIDQMTMLTSKLYCTMKESTKLCNITDTRSDGSTYVKWPTLEQLHKHLFGVSPLKLHNAFNDVVITFRCFYQMRTKSDICDENPEMLMLIKKLLPDKSPLKIDNSISQVSIESS
jgi:DNA polymerase-3 subunit alpha